MSGYPLVGRETELVVRLDGDLYTDSTIVVLAEGIRGAQGTYTGFGLRRKDARRLAEELLELSVEPEQCADLLLTTSPGPLRCEKELNHRFAHQGTLGDIRVCWEPAE